MVGKYEDIIHLSRPVSPRHAPMSNLDRAAQFSPFAALTGYEATIEETARLTEMQTELDEMEKGILDSLLQQIQSRIGTNPEVKFTVFEPDERKSGGAYTTVRGRVKRIDPIMQTVVFADRREIPIQMIRDIEIIDL